MGQGFGPAAGLPPGVVWDGDAPGETTRTRFFRGAAELPLGASDLARLLIFEPNLRVSARRAEARRQPEGLPHKLN